MRVGALCDRWRRTAQSDRMIVLREDSANGQRSCQTRGTDSFASIFGVAECDAREVALLEEPSRHVWLTHWLMPMPNPIYEHARDEMHCVSIS